MIGSSLSTWIRDADAARHLEHFRVQAQDERRLAHIRTRADDYYLALVGALFDELRGYGTVPTTESEWARLGNAFAQFADDEQREFLNSIGVSQSEALLFAATAFYCGGFPASAYLTVRGAVARVDEDLGETHSACFDLLSRRPDPRSTIVGTLLAALRAGDLASIAAVVAAATNAARSAFLSGPTDWIPARLLERLLERFQRTNLRAVLPGGESTDWSPLVASFLDRTPPAWEFFPSQIEAIEGGIIERVETFSLQMPTGAGKTALCETLLFRHATTRPTEVAILLVPLRALAAELRGSLVQRLIDMGIPSRCAYGGTVPTGEEVRDLNYTRVVVATPEALSGLLSSDAQFLRRVSLVICDEGHLLDGDNRGVSLELLLSRLRAKEGGGPRFVFMSAIVPNIEEINAWLGGQPTSVVRSNYRPALAEFAVLNPSGTGASAPVNLLMHPHEPAPPRFTVGGFLRKEDFQWTKPETGRRNTYAFNSYKTRAIAAARKALPMGGVVVFAANKRGDQGAVGLAEELLAQLEHGLSLPAPQAHAQSERLGPALEYLGLEYGADWIVARTLARGAVLHHGDIPQEAREVLERVLRSELCRFAICTSTLAEGVNLPIRTLVLYSVLRRGKAGPAEALLVRDIKNLVGRAGRAGSNTKGLVICANEQQWPTVEKVARQAASEPVGGALRDLVRDLASFLARTAQQLSDSVLEQIPQLHPLVDGIDATLIDLAAEEIGEERLVAIATNLADQTFASQQSDQASRDLLRRVFTLRARRVSAFGSTGRLAWVRETGARLRLLPAVESSLATIVPSWSTFTDPLDPALLKALLDWAWNQPGFEESARDAFRVEDEDLAPQRAMFLKLVSEWLKGRTFNEIAAHLLMDVDDVLGVHNGLLSFSFQTLVEQAVALLGRHLAAQEQDLAPAVLNFPEHLRFGVPTSSALALATRIRHRRAAVELGAVLDFDDDDWRSVFVDARRALLDKEAWKQRLGVLVFENTRADLDRLLGPDNVA